MGLLKTIAYSYAGRSLGTTKSWWSYPARVATSDGPQKEAAFRVVKRLIIVLLLSVIPALAQQPTFKDGRVTNLRVAPPSHILIPLVARIKDDGLVIVGYKLYHIQLVKHLPWEMLAWTDDKRHFRLDILAGQTLEDEQIAVAHEIMHASIGTDRSDERQSLHEAIYLFSTMLPYLLKLNPELGRYLAQ